jgi:hypothetical protein
MKKLSLFTVVIALSLGAAAMIRSRGSDAFRNSDVVANHITSGAFRDGLYLGKLTAERGGEPHIASGRWAADEDRASFTVGFQQGYHEAYFQANTNPE